MRFQIHQQMQSTSTILSLSLSLPLTHTNTQLHLKFNIGEWILVEIWSKESGLLENVDRDQDLLWQLIEKFFLPMLPVMHCYSKSKMNANLWPSKQWQGGHDKESAQSPRKMHEEWRIVTWTTASISGSSLSSSMTGPTQRMNIYVHIHHIAKKCWAFTFQQVTSDLSLRKS